MANSNIDIDKAGWSFDNTYSKLPDNLLVKQAPIPVKSPELIILNKDLSKDLDLDFTDICLNYFLEIYYPQDQILLLKLMQAISLGILQC
jgi:hypothetical protein